MSSSLHSARVNAMRYEAKGVVSCELQLEVDTYMPFEPGAHIDIQLPNGLMRSYSLCNSSNDCRIYMVAIGRDVASRGASVWVHDKLRVGDLLKISSPRNNFPLHEDAVNSVFIAGGIGITPIWCMVQRLQELGRNWSLHYASRNRAHAAFLSQLQEAAVKGVGTLHLHFDDEFGGPPDVAAAIAAASKDAHFYCCGPQPMMASFEKATTAIPSERVHLEYFQTTQKASTDGGFELELVRSGLVLKVAAGQSMLEVLLDAGIDVPFSCMDGICGSCETKVLEGVPDHRDMVLSDSEKAIGSKVMVCCSGAKSSRLVLEL